MSEFACIIYSDRAINHRGVYYAFKNAHVSGPARNSFYFPRTPTVLITVHACHGLPPRTGAIGAFFLGGWGGAPTVKKEYCSICKQLYTINNNC